jgi:hypothetical protein
MHSTSLIFFLAVSLLLILIVLNTGKCCRNASDGTRIKSSSREQYGPVKSINTNAPLSNCIQGCEAVFDICTGRYDGYSCMKLREACETTCDMNGIAAY